MPVTSLAQQLENLATPQTSLLFDKTKKPSFLFESKEAANFDRNTFHSIGLSGLEELININSEFERYKSTLFDAASVDFSRSVETAESNKKLNKEINRFLIQCYPYFNIRPVHKALEWLIQRYFIQDYCTDSLMMLILPYYESMLFARMLSLIPVKKSKTWFWLESVQTNGTALSKTALFNRAATDIGFFKMICNMPIAAVKVYKKTEGRRLGNLFKFYCTTIIGALKHMNGIKEVQVSHLLPSLLCGLSSPVIDFVASAFMIIGCLITKAPISNYILEELFLKVSQVKVKDMQTEAILLMIILCQCDNPVSEKVLGKLTQLEWFMPSVVQLHDSGVVVFPLIYSMLFRCVSLIMSRSDSEFIADAKSVAFTIFESLHFDDTEIQKIFHLFIDSCSKLGNMKGKKKNLKEDFESKSQWFVKLMQDLEKKYPASFDKVVTDPKYLNKAKKLISLRPEYVGQSDLFEKLHHPNPVIRAETISLVPNLLEPVPSTWLSETIVDRLSDDDASVVEATLNLPLGYLQSLIGNDKLARVLASTAEKIWCQNSKLKSPERLNWRKLSSKVLLKFSNCIPDQFDQLDILITVIPFLITDRSKDMKAVKVILSSLELLKKCPLLDAIKRELGSVNEIDEKSVKAVLWNSLRNPSFLASVINLNAIQAMGTRPVSNINRFILIWLAASGHLDKSSPEQSMLLLEGVNAFIKDSKLKYAVKDNVELNVETLVEISESCLGDELPLQVVEYFICSLIEKTVLCLDQKKSWQVQDSSSDFLLSIFKSTLMIRKSTDTKSYNVFFRKVTNTLCKSYFPVVGDYIKLLCNLMVKSPEIAGECLIEIQRRIMTVTMDNLNSSIEDSGSNIIAPTLLIALSSEDKETRQLALKMVEKLSSALDNNLLTAYSHLFRELNTWREEIAVDAYQVSVALYMLLSPDEAIQSSLSSSLRVQLAKVRETLIEVITNLDNPPHIAASLLDLLKHITSVDIMKKYIPLGVKILESENPTADQYNIMKSIIQKIEPSIAQVFTTDDSWTFVESCFKLQDGSIFEGSNNLSPAILLLKQITNEMFDSLTVARKMSLMDLIISVNAESESGDLNAAVTSVMKKISLNCAAVTSILCMMRDVKVATPESQKQRRRKWSTAPPLTLLTTPEWRKGVCLLELIQNKKKLHNVQLFIPLLFDLLRKCLEFEEQSPVEYTKQVVLSCILHCCRKLTEDDESKIPNNSIQVDLVVQCVRASQNPQTHHHALLLLSEIAILLPEKVLHDIMPIFTFVGSTVLRMDDAYSFQIILKIIETIIPILIKSVGQNERTVPVKDVLQVFVDALLDIPEHRRITLLHKLMTTLSMDVNSDSYLWLFVCLVAESEALAPTTEGKSSQSKRDVLLNLCAEFTPDVMLDTLRLIVKHVTSLPHEKEYYIKGSKLVVFDVEKNTSKQLRHYKYILMNFVSSFLTSHKPVTKIVAENEKHKNDSYLLPYFNQLVQVILTYLQGVSKQADLTANQPSGKYWKAMLNITYDILSETNALLPSEMFLGLMGSLLYQIPKVQRKVIELLNWRLQGAGSKMTDAFDPSCLLKLLPALLGIIQDRSTNAEIHVNQQAAFISIKLLARGIGSLYPDQFEKALLSVIDLMKERTDSCAGKELTESNGAVLASGNLCLAELVSCLGSRAIRLLPNYMPPLINAISRARTEQNIPDLLLLSVVTALQKVLEYHSNFVSPYLDQILTEVTLISSVFDKKDNHKSHNVVIKLDSIRKNISDEIDLRVLMPAVETCYGNLVKEKEYSSVKYLMSVLGKSFTASCFRKDLQNFLLEALDFRTQFMEEEGGEIVKGVESAVIGCIEALVLKLNEKEFSILYKLIYTWAFEHERRASVNENERVKKIRAITYYRLSSGLAETLKGLFVPYSNQFMVSTARLLDSNNSTKCQEDQLYFTDHCRQKELTKELLEALLLTLMNVFKYDNENIITEDRFNIIMQPLVDQLDNTLCFEDSLSEKVLIPCLGHMATSISDDVLWKKYNYQILLKLQNTNVQGRLAALQAVCEVAKKLGDSYLPLLPETIPFLAELLEDEDETVEKTCRRIIQDLETVLGEQISKYF